ncbi:flagellar hook-basal body complex protein FliE, partial [Brucella intermedia]|uniref:flagellar hook-basal body complex protein FliE n=1 Tax=Brucella intermedia TaxID=94625 RepID=UPI002248CAC5
GGLQLLADGIRHLRQDLAEATSIQGIKGDAPVRDVVSSVMEAEQSLQTAIAIRDKIVQAYLEISRMPI